MYIQFEFLRYYFSTVSNKLL